MVFSNPDVVKKVNADFIPVALKAAIVDNPPPGPERELYMAIRRTRAAPQGICTLNSAGHVLAWALSFQNEASIPSFFDHAKARYRAAPDQPIDAERFRRFPTTKMPDTPAGKPLQIPGKHKANELCAGAPPKTEGELAGTIVGRRIEANGAFVKNTRRQENYMEARVRLNRQLQTQLTRLAADAGSEQFELPEQLCRALIGPAFLGQLDVNPLGVRPGANENRVKKWQLVGQVKTSEADGSTIIRLTGTSHVEGGHVAQPNGPTWDHTVKLQWRGFAVSKKSSLSRLCLFASGSEKLTWGNENLHRSKEPEAEHLMAGHAIDVDSRVAYGLLLEK